MAVQPAFDSVGREPRPFAVESALTGNLAIGDATAFNANTGLIQIVVVLNSGTVATGTVSVYKQVDATNWAKCGGCDYSLATITNASHISAPVQCGMGAHKFVVTSYTGAAFNYDLRKIDF